MLREILESFQGTELKLSYLNAESWDVIPSKLFDFEWACAPNLRYFKLKGLSDLPIALFDSICR